MPAINATAPPWSLPSPPFSNILLPTPVVDVPVDIETLAAELALSTKEPDLIPSLPDDAALPVPTLMLPDKLPSAVRKEIAPPNSVLVTAALV